MGRTAAGPIDEQGAKISQKVLVEKAIEELGMEAMPEAIHDWIMTKYNYELPKGQISTYKSNLKKDRGVATRSKKKTAAKADKIPKEKGSESSVVESNHLSVASLLDLVNVIRNFEAKLGSARVLEVIDAMYKSKN